MAIGSISGIGSSLSQAFTNAQGSGSNPFAKLLAAAGNKANTPASTAPLGSQARVDSDRQQLVGNLKQLFTQAGVDTSQEIRLQLGSDGRVNLVNDHPDRQKIEQVLAGHPELAGKLAGLAGDLRSQKTAEGVLGSDSNSQATLEVTIDGDNSNAALV